MSDEPNPNDKKPPIRARGMSNLSDGHSGELLNRGILWLIARVHTAIVALVVIKVRIRHVVSVVAFCLPWMGLPLLGEEPIRQEILKPSPVEARLIVKK